MHKYIWPLKIAAKVVFTRLPVPYKLWKRVGMFRHGYMDSGSYALDVFRTHVKKAYSEGLPENFTFLELGPGDTIASALVAHAHGASKITLVDVGDYAEKDVRAYRNIARELKTLGLNVPDLEQVKTFSDVLKACNATYLTDGLGDLRSLPVQSIDLACSQSVLEHVRKRDFDATMQAVARVLKPTGRAAHGIDFKDHLAFSLNNLRFPEKIWENNFFANSGFYTNRLRPSEILARFAAAGFSVVDLHTARWPVLPMPRSKMLEPFRSMSDDDLHIRHMHLALTLKSVAGAGQKAA